MDKYSKIETLFDRGSDFRVDITKLRLPEFDLIDSWFVMEKLHGVNLRVVREIDKQDQIQFGARESTDLYDIAGPLRQHLAETFHLEKFGSFPEIALFGEGIGPGINKGGGYCSTPTFVLFDVKIGPWWLEPEDVKSIANQFGIPVCPDFGMMSKSEIVELVRGGLRSKFANIEHKAEGIIAKTVPGLLCRDGTRLMFKLKTKDFPQVLTPKKVAVSVSDN